MTIIGIGMDIVDIGRINTVLSCNGDRFARRILSLNEWIQYQNHTRQVRFLATRFAVKEATAKAFGTGVRNGLTFTQIEVFNDILGKPLVRLFAQAAELAIKLCVTNIHVSLADERDYACATVIFEK